MIKNGNVSCLLSTLLDCVTLKMAHRGMSDAGGVARTQRIIRVAPTTSVYRAGVG